MEISNVNSNPFVTSAKVEEEDEKEVKEEQTGEAAVKNPLEKAKLTKRNFQNHLQHLHKTKFKIQ